MQNMSKTAIIIGASGLTGGLLLKKLLKDERYSRIKLFSRRSSGISNSKIEEHLIDLFELENYEGVFKADVVFCCIGTTKKKTPDQSQYHKIDFGIPVAAAKLCKENGINTLIVMSSMGANTRSSIFYSRTKGEMEAAVLAENIPNTYLLRPSLIKGNRKEKRTGEKITAAFMSFFDLFLFGSLKKCRSIKAERIAEAMLRLANQPIGAKIIDSRQIQELADKSE
jgi:uncharacterized protein YbjT (DUF2867 family)